MIVHIWEFHVRAGAEEEFCRHYGPEGSWVHLFRRASGHIETVLLRDATVSRRYVTVDRWASAAAYAAFREQFGDEYATVDRACEVLIEREVNLGSLVEVA